VNMSQSSNDTFPTAMHVAAATRCSGAWCRRCAGCATRSTQGRGVRRHREDRPHAPAGRVPLTLGPGVRRLRRPARRAIARIEATLPGCTSSRSAAPRSAPGSTRRRFASGAAKIAELTGLPFVGAQQVRRARGATTRWCSRAARSRRWPARS
jgi:fumarate hydratase class II